MKEKSVSELKAMLDSKADFQLIDVREPHEWDICHLDATLIPMGDIMDHVAEIDRTKPVVVHCRSGKRSATIIQYLEEEHGFKNLYNLRGGILAWADEIDTTMSKY
jgi:adenylyltransferase/sulfurtransferase